MRALRNEELMNCPKNHGISKLVVWRYQNPAIQIQTGGPMILRVHVFFFFAGVGHCFFPKVGTKQSVVETPPPKKTSTRKFNK